MQGASQTQQRHRRGRAAALAETHAQVEQRLGFQRLQYPLVAGFGGGVAVSASIDMVMIGFSLPLYSPT